MVLAFLAFISTTPVFGTTGSILPAPLRFKATIPVTGPSVPTPKTLTIPLIPPLLFTTAKLPPAARFIVPALLP
ncbi:hypothetical protein [Rickettsia honei]|uniref:hypothetical protein n=1 Tax=Rickettsia honei TaxID=37816 RepID=UPI00035EC036|nr:hypothetical protein [Rickettsia honei]